MTSVKFIDIALAAAVVIFVNLSNSQTETADNNIKIEGCLPDSPKPVSPKPDSPKLGLGVRVRV